MKTLGRMRPLRIAALAAATLVALAGCANIDEVPISDSFPTGSNPTSECLRAAKEASYYCKYVTAANPEAQFKCDKARWEHARKC